MRQLNQEARRRQPPRAADRPRPNLGRQKVDRNEGGNKHGPDCCFFQNHLLFRSFELRLVFVFISLVLSVVFYPNWDVFISLDTNTNRSFETPRSKRARSPRSWLFAPISTPVRLCVFAVLCPYLFASNPDLEIKALDTPLGINVLSYIVFRQHVIWHHQHSRWQREEFACDTSDTDLSLPTKLGWQSHPPTPILLLQQGSQGSIVGR